MLTFTLPICVLFHFATKITAQLQINKVATSKKEAYHNGWKETDKNKQVDTSLLGETLAVGYYALVSMATTGLIEMQQDVQFPRASPISARPARHYILPRDRNC